MNAQIIDGKKIAAEMRKELQIEVEALKRNGIYPGLAVILVGDNPASHTYVRSKAKACEKIGIYSEVILYPDSIEEEMIMAKIDELTNGTISMGFSFNFLCPNILMSSQLSIAYRKIKMWTALPLET